MEAMIIRTMLAIVRPSEIIPALAYSKSSFSFP
jgi:hypothetical protein